MGISTHEILDGLQEVGGKLSKINQDRSKEIMALESMLSSYGIRVQVWCEKPFIITHSEDPYTCKLYLGYTNFKVSGWSFAVSHLENTPCNSKDIYDRQVLLVDEPGYIKHLAMKHMDKLLGDMLRMLSDQLSKCV